MTRAELKAMGVGVRGVVTVGRGMIDATSTRVLRDVQTYDVRVNFIAENFPTRAKAEQYARQLRKAMRGE